MSVERAKLVDMAIPRGVFVQESNVTGVFRLKLIGEPGKPWAILCPKADYHTAYEILRKMPIVKEGGRNAAA